MAESLIFIENANEIDAIENYVFEDTIIISMLPSVGVELSRREIPYINTLSLFGVDGHKETLKLSKLIVEGIRPLLNKINTNGIQNAFEKTWIVYFRIHLNYLLSSLFIINRAVELHNPSRLIIFRNKYNNNSLSQVVEKFGVSHGINIQFSDITVSSSSLVKKDKPIKQWIIKLIFEFQLRLFSIFVKKRNTFLVLNDTSNMPRLVGRISKYFGNNFPVYLEVQNKTLKSRMGEMLRGRTFSFVQIPKYIPEYMTVAFQQRYDGFVREIKRQIRDSNPRITAYSVDLASTIMLCIENDLKIRMLNLYGEIISLKRGLTIVRPKGVFAQHNFGIGYALGEICLKENIPGLLITHGSHTPQTDSLPSYEWAVHAHQIFNGMYPFVALQTPWAKKFLKKQDRVISKSIDTGPLIFAQPSSNIQSKFKMRCRLFGNNNSQKRIVLHAGSPKPWQSHRPWVYETIDEYIHNINIAIKSIEKLPELYLCIRFRPQKDLCLKDFKMSLVASECYGVFVEGSFEEFLLSSDLLISYSSTTIEEALHYHIPVMQFDPDGKYEHIKGKRLAIDGKNSLSTVYSVLTEIDLMPALRWWSDNHSEEINQTLDWKKHAFEYDENMEWLKIMGIKC